MMRSGRSIAVIVSFIATSLVTLSPEAMAARLPDWARTVAEAAPALGEQVFDRQTRILLDETHIEIQKDGTVSKRRRLATQALSAQVSSIDVQGLNWQQGVGRVTASRAWHLPAGDKARKSSLNPVDVTLDQNLLTDARQRLVSVNGIGRGSLVFFEFEMDEVPLDLSFTELFGDMDETLTQRFELELPAPAWTVRSAWLRRKGPEPFREGNLWRWELKDLPPRENEPLSASVWDEVPLLVVTAKPPAGTKLDPFTFDDWPSLASWYEGLIKGRDSTTAEITSISKKGTSEGKPAFAERIRELSSYVRDTVRYVAKEVGAGNYQPKAAGDVLAQLYGDCKDKGTLLRAVLGASGYVSYPILINATRDQTVSDEVPSPQAFNHFVVGVVVPSDAQAPPWLNPAIVDAGDLGRLLIIDVTNPYAAVGSLSRNLEGKKALVVAGSRSRLLSLPTGSSEIHRVDGRFRIELHEDGSLDVEGVTRREGEPAEIARAGYRASIEQHRKQLESQLRDIFVRAESFQYKAEAEKPDGAFVESLSWKVPAPRGGGPSEVPIFVDAANYMPRTSLSRRKTPVTYSNPVTIKYESALEGVPASVALPSPETRRGDGWSITSRCEREGEIIRGNWELKLSKTRFELSETADLKKLWQAVSTTGGVVIPLQP